MGDPSKAPRAVPGGRVPGWREALVVGALVVIGVFGLGIATSALPVSLQDVVFRTPLAIVVLLAGTVLVLMRIARPRP